MKSVYIVSLLLFIFSLSGCYHAKVVSDLEPSSKVYDKAFASSWIYGLVPPSVVKVSDECSEGVAIVETELSFVNMLVGAITLGIYTPMHIKVTCGGTSTADVEQEPVLQEGIVTVAKNASEKSIIDAFQHASDMAVQSGRPVKVAFR